jgi:hypothetical protein
LLLNQTYGPLGTVSVARAIIMTFKNTVFVEQFDGDRVLRSAHDEWPVPSVIRRRTYINVRRRREQSGMKRLRIYMRDKRPASISQFTRNLLCNVNYLEPSMIILLT